MTTNEKWDYKVEGKSSGIAGLAIFGVISVLFIALAISQCISAKDNSAYINAVFFLLGAITPMVALVKTAVYYFCFKLFIGKRGFYFSSTPFDGKYYRYDELKSCRKTVQTSRRRSGRSSGRGTKTFYFVIFKEKNGKQHKFLYDKAMFEHEINELIRRAGRAAPAGVRQI